MDLFRTRQLGKALAFMLMVLFSVSSLAGTIGGDLLEYNSESEIHINALDKDSDHTTHCNNMSSGPHSSSCSNHCAIAVLLALPCTAGHSLPSLSLFEALLERSVEGPFKPPKLMQS